MDRNEIHSQIETLTGKITFLNNRISGEQNLHPVETDLLQGYVKELHSMTEMLVKLKGDSTISSNQKQPAETARSEEAKEPPLYSTWTQDGRPLKMAQPKEKPQTVEPKPLFKDNDPAKNEPVNEHVEETVVAATTVSQAPAINGAKKISLNDKLKRETMPLSERLKGAKKKNLKELFDLNERY